MPLYLLGYCVYWLVSSDDRSLTRIQELYYVLDINYEMSDCSYRVGLISKKGKQRCNADFEFRELFGGMVGWPSHVQFPTGCLCDTGLLQPLVLGSQVLTMQTGAYKYNWCTTLWRRRIISCKECRANIGEGVGKFWNCLDFISSNCEWSTLFTIFVSGWVLEN